MHYIASGGQGQIIRRGQSDAPNEALTTLVICSKLQKTPLNSDFIQIFFMILYMREQGQISPMG